MNDKKRFIKFLRSNKSKKFITEKNFKLRKYVQDLSKTINKFKKFPVSKISDVCLIEEFISNYRKVFGLYS